MKGLLSQHQNFVLAKKCPDFQLCSMTSSSIFCYNLYIVLGSGSLFLAFKMLNIVIFFHCLPFSSLVDFKAGLINVVPFGSSLNGRSGLIKHLMHPI